MQALVSELDCHTSEYAYLSMHPENHTMSSSKLRGLLIKVMDSNLVRYLGTFLSVIALLYLWLREYMKSGQTVKVGKTLLQI